MNDHLKHRCGKDEPNRNAPWFHCYTCERFGCQRCEIVARELNQLQLEQPKQEKMKLIPV